MRAINLLRRTRPFLGALAGLVALLLAAAACTSYEHDAAVPSPLVPTSTPSAATSSDTPSSAGRTAHSSAGPTAPSSAGSTSPAQLAGPTVMDWGVTDSVLSLVVRNDAHRAIRSALVRVTLWDRQGRTLLSTAGRPGSKCCTMVSVRPGKRFGLYVTLPFPGQRVARVGASYEHVQSEPPHPSQGPRVVVRDPALTRTRQHTVVRATVTVHAPESPYLAGQAFLVDRSGDLVTVISGRFYCFRDGTTKRVRMQLHHPVPAGTRIRAVRGFSLPPTVNPDTRNRCR